ncbi:U6 snRNA phosphodiesterase 1 isoform X2 [Chanos chanos]|uniref:U6 snRNA phosphodiesterase n=1 Tax=Chanos chanos TaxID=29144 RepID=A0A6J2WCV2_CHACN|nr:U6 snRNA phosphodiesterase isoform X2 [Chanos chanos]
MIVNYSSSSSEEEEETDNLSLSHQRKRRSILNDSNSPPRKRDRSHNENSVDNEPDPGGKCVSTKTAPPRLPLPDSVLEMFRGSEETRPEDSTLHGGRIRSFEHERGNWATYVYFPYVPDDVFLDLLDEITAMAESHGVPLTRAEEFHVSLSQTVVLRHHWIQPFVQCLRTGLAQCRRTFLGMEISTGHAQLLDLVRAVDKTMEEFNLSTFYKEPSFHVSLAWCVGDYTEQILTTCLPKLQSLVDSHEDGRFQLQVNCTELRCKTGNKFFSFPLR